MKGIILAGGHGSRLFPITRSVSKHLLPIYDKPMIFYPLSILMLAGIREILLIVKPEDKEAYFNLLSHGEDLGLSLSYAEQDKPRGLAEAFVIGNQFISDDNVCLVLGDNIFWGQGLSEKLIKASNKENGNTIFAYTVNDPERFGVVSFKDGFPHKIEEKPSKPESNLAVTGLYFYDNSVVDIAKQVQPSKRGELEISSINDVYLKNKETTVEILGRGFAWLDTGTCESLLEAGKFVETIEKRQGYKIACLEEIAYLNKWISKENLLRSSKKYKNSEYGLYLENLLD